MSIPGSSGALFLATAAAGGGGYQIERSLRFNSSDSAFCSRTPGTVGTRTIYTLSAWVKRAALTTRQMIFSATNGGDADAIYFHEDNTLRFHQRDGLDSSLITTQVFRDASAWYHIVLAVDTTQGTSSNRVKIYVNGTQITTFSTATYPSPSYTGGINNTVAHNIGRRSSVSDNYLDAYLADIQFIDGQALDTTAFTEVSATTGQLIPKAYTGSFGTNGFWLKFSDNSAATATTLGKDYSGNSNNWTPNNLSVVATTIDYVTGQFTGTQRSGDGFSWTNMFDTQVGSIAVPEAGSSFTWTPTTPIPFTTLQLYVYKDDSPGTLRINGTDVTSQVPNHNGVGPQLTTITGISSPLSSLQSISYGSLANIGLSGVVINGNQLVNVSGAGNDSLVDSPTSYGTDTGAGGEVRGNYCTLNPLQLATTSTPTLSNGNLDFSYTAQLNGSRSLATIACPTSGKWYWEFVPSGSAAQGLGMAVGSIPLNGLMSGDRFLYQENALIDRSSGTSSYGATYGAGDVIGVAFNADSNQITFYKNNVSQGVLSTTAGAVYFPCIAGYNSTVVANFGQRPFAYTAPSGFKALCTANLPTPTIANGATAMDVKLYTGNGSTQTISGLNFSPDLVWIKDRTTAYHHWLTDTVRGVSKQLSSSQTIAETSYTTLLTAFNSNGFSLGNDSAVNNTSDAYAAWCWDAGSTTVTNTQGSITSQVRANASAGFSVATWTGTGSGSATVGHGLGVAPRFMIVKDRNLARNWIVYHTSLGATSGVVLNGTSAASGADAGWWNNTAPTSTVATIGVYGNEASNYVGYFWTPVDGYSSFGSYTGNGSADGPFVYTGFRPKFIMIKASSRAGTFWEIRDTSRDTYNASIYRLYPNASNAEETGGGVNNWDILSNGFKLRTDQETANFNGATFIYAAFAESPFQYARAR